MTPEERTQHISTAEGPRIAELLMQAVGVLRAKHWTQSQRGEKLMEISDQLSATITPHTPCAKGCSHCCHMATAISGWEAGMIGRYVGRTPRKLGREHKAELDMQQQLIDKFTGVPCPFLAAGKCSIYAVRPIACRIHHSLNEDESNCEIIPGVSGERSRVPHLNLTVMVAATAAAFIADDYGDIREFFPGETPCET